MEQVKRNVLLNLRRNGLIWVTRNPDPSDLLQTERTIWMIAIPLFLTIGTIGNVCIIWVLCKRRQKKRRINIEIRRTFDCYMLFLAIADLLALYSNLIPETDRYIGSSLLDDSAVVCRLYYYTSYTFSCWSSWIVVALSLDRMIHVYKPLLDDVINRRLAKILLTVITLVLFLINGHFFWTAGLQKVKWVFYQYLYKPQSTDAINDLIGTVFDNTYNDRPFIMIGLSYNNWTAKGNEPVFYESLGNGNFTVMWNIPAYVQNSINISYLSTNSEVFSDFVTQFYTQLLARLESQHYDRMLGLMRDKFSLKLSQTLVQDTKSTICGTEDESIIRKIISWTDLAFYSAIPLLLMSLANVMIIASLIRNRSWRRANNIQQSSVFGTSIALLSICFLFILTVSPLTVISLYEEFSTVDFIDLNQITRIKFLKACAKVLSYLNHSCNFIVYGIVGSSFRHDVRVAFKQLPNDVRNLYFLLTCNKHKRTTSQYRHNTFPINGTRAPGRPQCAITRMNAVRSRSPIPTWIEANGLDKAEVSHV